MLEKFRQFPTKVKLTQGIFLVCLIAFIVLLLAGNLEYAHYMAFATLLAGCLAASYSIVNFRTGSWPLSIPNIIIGIASYIVYLFMSKPGA